MSLSGLSLSDWNGISKRSRASGTFTAHYQLVLRYVSSEAENLLLYTFQLRSSLIRYVQYDFISFLMKRFLLNAIYSPCCWLAAVPSLRTELFSSVWMAWSNAKVTE